jgi:parallel beta-helix repeat protein
MSVPGAPTITLITPGNAQLSVAFTAATGTPTTYEYSIDNGVTFAPRASGITASPLVIIGLTNGTLYDVRIRAVNGIGPGPSSNMIQIKPGAPNITLITPGNAQLSVAFTAPTGMGTITTYKYSIDDGVNYTVRSTGTTASPLVITSLTNGTTYNVLIRAVIGGVDGISSKMVQSTPRTVPSAPTIDTITPSSGSLSVNFTAASDGGSAITNYAYSTNNGSSFTTRSPVATTSPITISPLTNGTTYNIVIRAINAAGNGTSSSAVAAVPYTIPPAPTIGTITYPSTQTISVPFTQSSTGGSAITNYEYSTDNGFTFTSAGTTSSPLVISNLSNGTMYTVKLRAINAAGTGTSSVAKTATPRTEPGAIVATVTANTTTTISFSWPTPSVEYSGVLTYKISLNGAAPVTISSGITTDATTTYYTRPSLVAGTAYFVYFTATNGVALTSTSNTMSTGTLTTTPRTVSASKASNTSIAISFTAPLMPATNPLTIASYTVTPYISGVAGVPLIGYTSSPITISDLYPGIVYTYTIAAVTSIGTGTASTQTTAIVLSFVAAAPSDVSYIHPAANTASATYANATLIYTDLSHGQGPVVDQVSPCVWTVAYAGFMDTLTNVKTVVFTDISGLFVDLSYGTYGSLMSQAHTAARAVDVSGDIIYMGVGKFVDYSVGPTLSKSVTVQGVGPGPTILQNSLGGEGPVNTVNITGHNITLKNLTIDNSNLTNYSNPSPGFLLLCVYDPTPAFLPPGQPADPSGNFPPIRNFVCDSCIFTNALTNGLDLSGSYDYNRRGVALNRANNAVIRNCTFPKTYDNGLTLTSSNDCKVENCTFYACKGASIFVGTSNQKGLSYTTTNIDLSDPSNNFIDISAGTYVNSRFGGPIVPTSVINMQPYSPTYFAPFTFGTTGTPAVTLPASMDYVYIADPTVEPSESVLNRATRQRYTSTQVYLESLINTYSWYGYQFSTDKHLIENRFNPIPLLNNLSTATPEGSTVLNPHVIEFQRQSDVLLLTNVSMSAVTYNQVVVVSDDVSGTYIYNSNVATTLDASYTTDLYIIPNTIPDDLSSNPYPGINPTALVSVTTVSGDPYTYSSDAYKYRISAEQLPYLPAVRGQAWYTTSATERQGLLTGPEKVPFAPTVALSYGNHSLTVTWTDNPGAALTEEFLLDISSATEHYTFIGSASGSHTFAIINNGTTFIATVTAVNDWGSATSAPQSIVIAGVPNAPTEEETTVGATSLIVNWTPNNDGGSPILSYSVYWYVASSGLLDGSANSISAISDTYTITGLTTGVAHDWAVSATNAFGEGAQSSQGPNYTPSVPPGPPTNVVGTRLNMSVCLVWDPPTSAGGSAILYYNIYDASTGVLDISSNGNNNSVDITGLTNGQPYSFYVKAVNSVGEGAASEPSEPVTPAGIPLTSVTNLAIASVGVGTVTLSFDPAPAIVNGAPFVRYNIFQSNASGFTLTNHITDTYTVTGLTAGTTYYFKISIENDVGEGPQSAAVGPAVPLIPVTLSMSGLTVVYNGTVQLPVVSSAPAGVSNSDVSFNYTVGGAPFTGTSSVGSYEITATLTNLLYLGADVSGTFVITAAPLTVTGVTVSNKAYNGTTTATLSGAALSGTIHSPDVVTLNSEDASGNFISVNVGTDIKVTVDGYQLSGSSAQNYEITNQPITELADITPAPLTVTGVTAANKAYDGTTAAVISGGSLNGIYVPDIVTLDADDASGNFVTANVGTGKTVVVGGYSLSGASSANYAITGQPFNLTANITIGVATIDVSGLSWTYDTTAHEVIVTTTPPDLSYNVIYSTSNINVGTCGFTVKINDPNYSQFYIGFLTIAAVPLTITGVSASNKPYDGTSVATLTGGVLNGVYPADSVGIIRGTGTFAQSNVDSSIAVTASGFDLSGVKFDNYLVAAQPLVVAANITKAVAVIDVSGLTVPYTGSPLAPTIVRTTPADLSYNITYTGNHTDVSSYPFTVTIDEANYTGTVGGTLVVTKARAGITLTGLSVVSNEAGHLATVAMMPANITLTGLSVVSNEAGHLVTVATMPADLSYNIIYDGVDQGPFSAIGNYPFTLSINDTSYYGDVSGTLRIAVAAATIDLSGLSVVYNGGSQNPIVTTTPPDLSYSIVYDDGNNIDAGSHPFTILITEAGYAGEARETLVITPAPLVIQANDQLRPYYLIPVVTYTTFSYYNFTIGPGEVTTTNIIAAPSGLYPRDSIAGVTLTIEPSANELLTSVTTLDVTWTGATATLIPDQPNDPYEGALVISAAYGTGLDNYVITYGSGDLSVVPTVAAMPVFLIASYYDTTITLSWLPPETTDGGIPRTAMQCILYNGDLPSETRIIDESTLGGLNTLSLTDVSSSFVSAYAFQIAIVNAVGIGELTNLTDSTQPTFEENAAIGAEQIVYISETLSDTLNDSAQATLTNVIISGGSEDILNEQNILYTFLESFRKNMDTASDGVFAYSEAQILATAIHAVNPDVDEITLILNGPPEDTDSTQAIAVFNHMVTAYNTDNTTVSESLIQQLYQYIYVNSPPTPFPMRISSQFKINSSNEQIEPYPVLVVSGSGINIIPVPHRIPIYFYLQMNVGDISGRVLLSRDADNMITDIQPAINIDNISGITFPAAAGCSFVVTYTSHPTVKQLIQIPALADATPVNFGSNPTNLVASQNGSNIVLTWTPPVGTTVTSYIITASVNSTNTYTVTAPASRYFITDLSVTLAYSFIITPYNGATAGLSSDPATFTPSSVPCFPAGTRILTPTGYRIVDELRTGDTVSTADGRSVSIKMYSDVIESPTEKVAPYLIPAHCYGPNMPPADLRLSPLHAFQTQKGLWHVPRHAFNDKVRQYGVGISVTYYHIECPNYFRDNLIVDGCVVESFAGKQVRDYTKIFTFSQQYRALIRSSGDGNRNEPQQQSK